MKNRIMGALRVLILTIMAVSMVAALEAWFPHEIEHGLTYKAITLCVICLAVTLLTWKDVDEIAQNTKSDSSNKT